MKKNIIYLATICLGVATLLTSCDKFGDKLEPRDPKEVKLSMNAFDKWLRINYIAPYNIEYKYEVDDSERNHQYVMPPAKMENIMKMSRLIRYAWLGTYDEVCGKDFLRQLSPRIITPYGAWAWQKESRTLATAEGGLKVVLYGLNNLNLSSVDRINAEYFHTMHHEFTHILHQNKKAPVEFNTISAEGYSPAAWFNRTNEQANALGFVTAYASRNTEEDLTEVTAAYITFTPKRWEQVKNAAGEKGWAMILKKIDIMLKYMKSVWGIDMDNLKSVAKRRTIEIIGQKDKLILDEWKPLLDQSFRSSESIKQDKKEQQELISALAKLHEDASIQNSRLNCTIITHYLSH